MLSGKTYFFSVDKLLGMARCLVSSGRTLILMVKSSILAVAKLLCRLLSFVACDLIS